LLRVLGMLPLLWVGESRDPRPHSGGSVTDRERGVLEVPVFTAEMWRMAYEMDRQAVDDSL
jgi:hypothetical protein